MVEKPFPDPILKNQNWSYLWINGLTYHTVCFCCKPSRGLSKDIKTKLQTTYFYLIQKFFKNQKEV